jgi:DNA-directed RNA polymerase-3 subunit RPC5
MHQLRPTLTYLDALSRKNKRRTGGTGSDSDSDDGPPPDPDDPAPRPPSPKKEKKSAGEPREVQVSARKSSDDKGGMQPLQGGLSTVRREILLAIRTENEEAWEDLEFCDVEVGRGVYFYCKTIFNLKSGRQRKLKAPSKLYSRKVRSH